MAASTDAAVLEIVKDTLGRLSEGIESLAMKADSNSTEETIYYQLVNLVNSEIEAIEDRIDNLNGPGAANDVSDDEDDEMDEDGFPPLKEWKP